MNNINKNLSRYEIVILFGILVFTILLYTGMFNNGPYNDDFSWMRNCFRENTCQSIPGLILQSMNFIDRTHFYRPVAEIVFTFMSGIFGVKAYLYHVVSLILHLLNGILVYQVLKLLFRDDKPAMLGMFLFLIHAGTNETVYWISGIITLTFTLFYLIALMLFLKSIGKEKLPGKHIAGIILFAGLALLTKETAVTILPVLILTWVFYGRNLPGKKWLLFGVMFAIIAAFLAIQYYVETKNYLVVEELYKPGVHFFKNTLIFHVILMFPKEINSVFNRHWMFLLPTFLLTIAGLVFCDKHIKYLVLWCWVTMLPAAFFDFGLYIASRYLYLTSIGFCGVMGYVFFLLWQRWENAAVLRSLLLLPLILFIMFNSYKTFFNDLYFEAHAERYERIFEEIKKQYPVIPANTHLFLFRFPTLQVHLNAMMKVWEDPTLEAYNTLALPKLEPGSIILINWPDGVKDLSKLVNREDREIEFGSETTVLYLVDGWTKNVREVFNNYQFNWVHAQTAICQAPIWEHKRYTMNAHINYVPKYEKQTGYLDVRMNDRNVGRIDLTAGWHDYDLMIPRNSTKYGYNEISFSPGTEYKPPKKAVVSKIARAIHPGNVAFSYVQFVPIAPVKGEQETVFPVKKLISR